jgi:(p)ppGpp synthase/HD superfamily hydrolase
MVHLKEASENGKIVKLADRIDNLRTLEHENRWPNEKCAKYIVETERYILPIARTNEVCEKKINALIESLKSDSRFREIYLAVLKDSQEYIDTEPHRPKEGVQK